MLTADPRIGLPQEFPSKWYFDGDPVAPIAWKWAPLHEGDEDVKRGVFVTLTDWKQGVVRFVTFASIGLKKSAGFRVLEHFMVTVALSARVTARVTRAGPGRERT